MFSFFHLASAQDVHVGNLKVNSKYRVSVGAYGWAGEGRPSMPRDVSTASHGKRSIFFSVIAAAALSSLTRRGCRLRPQISACRRRRPLSLPSWLFLTRSWPCRGSRGRAKGAHPCFTSWWPTSGQCRSTEQPRARESAPTFFQTPAEFCHHCFSSS